MNVISGVSHEEAILIEEGAAPILWAVYLHKLNNYPLAKKNIIRTASTIIEGKKSIPENVIIEAYLLIERMEYENSCLFSDITAEFMANDPQELRRLGICIGLSATSINENSPLNLRFNVPSVDVDLAFANELSDPFMDMFAARLCKNTNYSFG